MTLLVVFTLLVNAVANSALYFLMASGLTLIFGLLRVVNFAHGALFLSGAYAATFLYTSTHNLWLALIGGLISGAVLGWIMERGLISSVYHNGTQQLLLTMGILIVLDELLKMTFGINPVTSSTPTELSKTWLIGHFVLIEYQLFTILVGIGTFVGLQLLLKKTRLGMVIRAGVTNPDLVLARGIPIRRVFTVVFAVGAALAGLAGALAGPYYGSVTPDMGMTMQLNAFIIVVVGGLGSLEGSLLGSILIATATAIVSYYFSSFAILVNVAVMAVVLIIRPQGLFGQRGVAS